MRFYERQRMLNKWSFDIPFFILTRCVKFNLSFINMETFLSIGLLFITAAGIGRD